MSWWQKLNWPINLKHITDAEMYDLSSSAKEWDTYYNKDLQSDVLYTWTAWFVVKYEKPYKIIFKEDWESGWFTHNNWNLANDLDNIWMVWNSESAEWSYSSYISYDNTDPWYDVSASSTSHKYVDIDIPTGSTDGKLTLYTRVWWESGNDTLNIYHTDTSHTPSAWSTPWRWYTNISWDIVLEPSYTKHEYTFDVSWYAWDKVRLVFTWDNDWSGWVQPWAIDDMITFWIL